MVGNVGGIRIWSAFFVAYVGGTLALLFESTIGEWLGVYSPLLGYLQAEIYAGVPIGFVAALASRTWRGLLMFVLGLMAAGATLGVVIVINGAGQASTIVVGTFYFAFWLGFLGVPTYAIVTSVVSVLRLMFPDRDPAASRRRKDR